MAPRVSRAIEGDKTERGNPLSVNMHLDRDLHLDGSLRIISFNLDIVDRVIEDRLHVRIQNQTRHLEGCAAIHHLFDCTLFDMIAIQMRIANREYEVTWNHTHFFGHKVDQQCVGRNVKRRAESNVITQCMFKLVR